MVTLNFGFEQSTTLSIAQTWLLVLFTVILFSVIFFLVIFFVALKAHKKQCALCFRYVTAHFYTIWYFFIVSVLTVLTMYNFDDINYKELNFAAIAASALIVLLFLPFFRRISAFGVEAETISVLENRAKLAASEQLNRTGSDPDFTTPEQEEMLQKLQSLKSKLKAD